MAEPAPGSRVSRSSQCRRNVARACTGARKGTTELRCPSAWAQAGGRGCDNMTIRTLVLQRLQFGLEPLAFRRGATRVLARVAGRPREEAPVTAEDLRQDFRLDAASAEALLRALVANRLLARADTTSGAPAT